MSHHISSRFVGAFAKIHITQSKYFYQNSKNVLGSRIFVVLSCLGITGKIIHSNTPGI